MGDFSKVGEVVDFILVSFVLVAIGVGAYLLASSLVTAFILR